MTARLTTLEGRPRAVRRSRAKNASLVSFFFHWERTLLLTHPLIHRMPKRIVQHVEIWTPRRQIIRADVRFLLRSFARAGLVPCGVAVF